MSLNQTFCSILLSDARKELCKILSPKALKDMWTYKHHGGCYEVQIPKNPWLPKGYYWYGSASSSSEAKSNCIMQIETRITENSTDGEYLIIVRPEISNLIVELGKLERKKAAQDFIDVKLQEKIAEIVRKLDASFKNWRRI